MEVAEYPTPLARLLASDDRSAAWLAKRLGERGHALTVNRCQRLAAGQSRMLADEAVWIAGIVGVSVEDLLPVAAGASERAGGGGE